MVFPSENDTLSPEQAMALELLRSGENVFLTGGAGSGKSHLIRHFQKELNPKEMPTLASTGAAAVLLAGRTFHSFFGLGIMDGGPDATFQRGIKDRRFAQSPSQCRRSHHRRDLDDSRRRTDDC